MFAVIIVGGLLSACMNISSTLTVRSDGSGTLSQRVVAGPQIVQTMHSIQQAFDSTSAPNPLFTEEEIRAEADSLSGMTIRSVTMIADDRGEGYEAVYAFEDLNAFRLAPSPGDMMGEEQSEDGTLDLMSAMDFEFTSGSPATLTVRIPRDSAIAEVDEPASDTLLGVMPDSLYQEMEEDEDSVSEEELQMMRSMMGEDARFRLAVVVEGEIVETDATFRSGSTVTLVDIDFGQLAQDPEAFRKMMTLSEEETMPNTEAAIDSLNAFPGVTFEPQQTITIRFQ